MIISRVHNQRGISALGILIAVMILAAMGAAMAVLVSSNQSTRMLQLYSDQSFATAQAGVEFALAKIYGGVNPCSSLNVSFLGDSFLGDNITITRENNLVTVVGVRATANTTLSVTDPIPPNDGQLIQVDTTNAKDAGNGGPPRKLTDIAFQLAPGCGQSVTVTSLSISWAPNNGENVLQIKFDGVNVYNGVGMPSGSTINIVDQTIADASLHLIDFIRWDNDIQDRVYTIQFNFMDGSNKIVQIDLT